jgi:ribonuclease HII
MDAVPVAGVDEAGRGPLAGRVYAAAVILPRDWGGSETLDSKRMSERARDRWFKRICAESVAFAVAWAEVEEIDRLNILNATLLAMQRAVGALNVPPARCRIDGNRCPDLPVPSDAIVGGDALLQEIGAASILAKVTRDRYMREAASRYPEYGFERHKGYATPDHLRALERFGACPIHRRSFAPVREVLRT